MTDNLSAEALIELRRFLDGSGDLDGCSFGEKPGDAKGAFWWRKHLTRLDEAAATLERVERERDEFKRELNRELDHSVAAEAQVEALRKALEPLLAAFNEVYGDSDHAITHAQKRFYQETTQAALAALSVPVEERKTTSVDERRTPSPDGSVAPEAPRDLETLRIQLDAIRRQADRWVEFNTAQRAKEGLSSDDDTHLIAPPFWPSHGQLKAWSAALVKADAALASSTPESSSRPCTCHPADNPPVPCERRYALSDCRAAAYQRHLDYEAMTTIAAHLREHPAEPFSGRQCEEHVLEARDRLYARPAPAEARSVSLALQEIERLATLETTESLSATIVRIGQIAKAARS